MAEKIEKSTAVTAGNGGHWKQPISAEGAFPVESVEDGVAERFSSRTAFAVRLLRRLEREGLRIDQGKVARPYAELGDAWWVTIDGEVSGPSGFGEVIDLLLEGWGPLSVLHVSEGENPDAVWRELRYAPLWRRPGVALAWTIGCWAVALVFGYGLVQLATPYRFQGVAGAVYWVGVAALAGWIKLRGRGGSGKGKMVEGVDVAETEVRRSVPKWRRLVAGVGVSLFVLVVAVWLAGGDRRSEESPNVDRAMHQEEVRAEGVKVETVATDEGIGSGAEASAAQASEMDPVQVDGTAVPEGATIEPLAASTGDAEPEPETTMFPAESAATPAEEPASTADEIDAMHLPALVRLKEPIDFPAVMNGRVVGSVTVPAGGEVFLVERAGGNGIAEFKGGRQRIALGAIGPLPESPAGGQAAPKPEPSTTGIQQPVSIQSEEVPAIAAAEPAAQTLKPMSPSLPAAGDSVRGGVLTGLAHRTVAEALQLSGENRGRLESALASLSGKERDYAALLVANASQYDLVNLTEAHLAGTVRAACRTRSEAPWGTGLPEDLWAEFVLPYRIADEDLDDWRADLAARVNPAVGDIRTTREAVQAIHKWLWKGNDGGPFVKFEVTENRDQAPRQLLDGSGIGRCFEINVLFTALLRAAGIPARHTGTSWWRSNEFYHYWVEYWDSERKDWAYIEGASANPKWFMGDGVKMATVFAMPGFPAVTDPIGRERWDAMIDVTARYNTVGKVEARATPGAECTVYLWNLSAWRPVALARADESGRAVFEVAVNPGGYPYLVSAGRVDGSLAWTPLRVDAGGQRVDLTRMSGEETVMEFLAYEKKKKKGKK